MLKDPCKFTPAVHVALAVQTTYVYSFMDWAWLMFCKTLRASDFFKLL